MRFSPALQWPAEGVLLDAAGPHPSPLSLVLICGVILAITALFVATHHPVREPKRALIFRLATLHRVSGPGYVFVLPFFEHIEDELHMGLREMRLEVPLEGPGDPAHLDITWRIHPSVRGRPPSPVHDILLASDELRAKLVRESIARAAGWVLIEYSHDDLTIPAARESIAHTVACTANAELAACGLLVERIFWHT